SLNDTGLRGKNEERSAGRSTECSTSSRKSPFIPKTDFAGRFDEIKIKKNEMFRNFNSTFVKNDDVLKLVSSSLKHLNPNCEPFVPTESLEQASKSTSSGHGDRDVNPFDPKEFHEKVCCFACGRPGHIARICLHWHTEFFYGKNQKVTTKAKPTER
ncbi:hypothetical protein R6Q57_013141, partial [Mikania cordata]